jgi:hypothetical protein
MQGWLLKPAVVNRGIAPIAVRGKVVWNRERIESESVSGYPAVTRPVAERSFWLEPSGDHLFRGSRPRVPVRSRPIRSARLGGRIPPAAGPPAGPARCHRRVRPLPGWSARRGRGDQEIGDNHRSFAGSFERDFRGMTELRIVGLEPQQGMRVGQQPHSMSSLMSSSGSLISSGTTSRPFSRPAFGTPVTGGRGRLEASR